MIFVTLAESWTDFCVFSEMWNLCAILSCPAKFLSGISQFLFFVCQAIADFSDHLERIFEPDFICSECAVFCAVTLWDDSGRMITFELIWNRVSASHCFSLCCVRKRFYMYQCLNSFKSALREPSIIVKHDSANICPQNLKICPGDAGTANYDIVRKWIRVSEYGFQAGPLWPNAFIPYNFCPLCYADLWIISQFLFLLFFVLCESEQSQIAVPLIRDCDIARNHDESYLSGFIGCG